MRIDFKVALTLLVVLFVGVGCSGVLPPIPTENQPDYIEVTLDDIFEDLEGYHQFGVRFDGLVGFESKVFRSDGNIVELYTHKHNFKIYIYTRDFDNRKEFPVQIDVDIERLYMFVCNIMFVDVIDGITYIDGIIPIDNGQLKYHPVLVE